MKFSPNSFLRVLRLERSAATPAQSKAGKKSGTTIRASARFCGILSLSAVTLVGSQTAFAQTRTWDGGGGAGNDNWGTLGNWDNDALPETTANVVFGTAFTSGTDIDLVTNRTVNSLTIDTATAFVISGGNTLTLTSGQLTRNDVSGTEGNHSITAGITLGANGVFNVNGDGTLTIVGAISDGANSYGLTKSGNGVLILSGADETYNGDTIVTGGVLRLGAANQLANGTGDGNLVVNSGGVFDLAGFSETVNGLSGNGIVDKSVAGTTTLTVGDGNVSSTFSGTITNTLGTLVLAKTGTGTLSLSGNNTFGGGLDLGGGTLILGHNSAAGSGTLTLGNNTTVQGTGGARTITNNLAIGGNLIFSGAENLEFTDSFDQIAGRTYTVNNTTTFSGAIIGNNTLTKSGTGTLILSANNTIAAVTVNTGGALRVANDGALGTTAADTTVNSGGALELIGGRTIGAEALSLSGTGVSNGGALRNISGNNSYAGEITLPNVTGVHRINSDSGLLTIGAGGISETGTANNKDLTFGGAGNIAVTGNIVMAGTNDLRVFKDGSGTLTLSGTNTYDGTTTVSAGTLLANNSLASSATGTGEVAVGASGILGGTGRIAPTGVNGINVTGVLAPGGEIGTGMLTIDLGGTTGNVTMIGSAGFQYQLGIAGLTIGAFGTSDLLTIAGAAANDFVFSGNNIDFLTTGSVGFYKLFDTSLNLATTWTGLTFDGTGLITAGLTYSNLTSGLSGSLIMGGNSLGGDSGDIYLQVVPEPTAAMLGGIGALLLLRRRRGA